MPVSVTDAVDGPFYPNGATVSFPFSLKAVSPDEVSVGRLGSNGAFTLYSKSAFTVLIGVDDEGGEVVFSSPPPTAGGELYIVSDPFFAEETLFEDEGPFNVAVLNPVVDRAAVRAIYLRYRLDRSIQAPFGAPMRALPPVPDRAFKLLGFDYEGQPTATDPVDLGFDVNGDFDGGIDGADDGEIFLGGLDG